MEPDRDAPAFAQCNGKERFSSPQVAAKVARRLSTKAKRRDGFGRKPLESYRCPLCRFFHVGRVRR